MRKNLSIFSFKKIPRAAALAFLCFVLLEILCFLLVRSFENASRGGDLIKMDDDLLNRNLRIYATPSMDMPESMKQPLSLEEMWNDEPYDAIVFGTSVIETGWVEMLQRDYGLKVVYTQKHKIAGSDIAGGLGDILRSRRGRSRSKPTILLFGDLTERLDDDSRIKTYTASLLYHTQEKPSTRSGFLPSSKVLEYVSNKNYPERVKIFSINGRHELFYVPDVEGLAQKSAYTESEYLKLVEFLRHSKKLSAEAGFVFAIAAFPTKAQQYEWLLIENGALDSKSKRTNLHTLKKASKDNNIPFIDMEKMLDPIARNHYAKTGKLFWYQDDTHMNITGSQQTAILVDAFLKSIKRRINDAGR